MGSGVVRPIRQLGGRRRLLLLGPVSLLLGAHAGAAFAQLGLPPRFTAQLYVTGEGLDPGGQRGAPGIPAATSLALDETGALYLARTGARFRSGEAEDFSALYRIPAGGARLTPETESRYLHGPPLRNPQVGAVGGRGEVWVTTYDRDRRLGALYRMVDGRPALVAGGTPPPGRPPLLRLPEGVALDPAGSLYVADREQNAIVRLDATSQPGETPYVTLTRPRFLAIDLEGQLWVAGDGTAETPWQSGAGQLWRVPRGGAPALVLEGPLPAGIAVAPDGALFVAQRRTGQIFAMTPDGRRIEFASAGQGGGVRGLAFAPVTAETRRAGIAGDLFVILVSRQLWTLNEVIRVSGPFGEFVRAGRQTP